VRLLDFKSRCRVLDAELDVARAQMAGSAASQAQLEELQVSERGEGGSAGREGVREGGGRP